MATFAFSSVAAGQRNNALHLSHRVEKSLAFFSVLLCGVCVFIDCVCVRRHAPSETRNYSKATEERLAAQNGRCVRQPGASIALRQQQREAQNGKFY